MSLLSSANSASSILIQGLLPLGILLVEDFAQAIEVANQFAAEHVALMVRDPLSVYPLIRNAGEVVFGDFPIISLANYAMGVNAILPTSGKGA